MIKFILLLLLLIVVIQYSNCDDNNNVEYYIKNAQLLHQNEIKKPSGGKNYPDIIKNYEKAINMLIKSNNDNDTLIILLKNIAQVYINWNKPDNAIIYINKALNIIE